MIDFSKAISPEVLTPKYILSKVSDNRIFAYYFGDFKVKNAIYHSKVRKDENASVGFFIGNSGEIVYKDFATDEKFNCFQYVQQVYGCDFKAALTIIASDFGLIDPNTRKVTKKFLDETENFDREVKEIKLVQFEAKPWDKKSLEWWRYYEITENELIANNVFNVNKLFIDKKEVFNTKGQLRFAYLQEYVGEDGTKKQGVKIYTPSDQKYKWISSIPLHIPFGIQQLKKDSETIFITKSQKDRIELLKIYSDVLATQNESEAALPIELQDWIFKYYKRAIIVYGVDDQAEEVTKKLVERGFEFFTTPREEYDKNGIEDPADYIRWYGLDAFKDLLKAQKLL